MPSPRQYATNAARQAAYRARCAPAAGPPAPPSQPGYRRWAVLLAHAQGVLSTVADEMTAYDAARSVAWHESERGEAFVEQLAAIEELRDQLLDLPLRPEA
jgi:hypothetical protein